MTLVLSPEHELHIRNHAESTYPGECCGVFIGDVVNGVKYVSQVLALSNAHEDGPSRRFRVDPVELLNVERLARKLKSSVIGFYHSHPDVPPVPSNYDLAHAWESYSYLIVRVDNGAANTVRSWAIGPDADKFVEEKIVISECIVEQLAKNVHNAEEARQTPSSL